MLKHLFRPCFTFTLLIAAASASSAQEEPLSALIKRVKHAVVVVNTYDCHGEPLLRGSGFFVEPQHLVTGMHVLQGACSAQIETFDGRAYPVEGVAAVDEKRDLALLQAVSPSSPITTLSIESTVPQEGEEVIVISNPRGAWNVSKGHALAIWDFQNIGEVMRITAHISPGSSGGPVINRRGQVVGVALMQVKSAEELNFAMPGQWVVALKRSVTSGKLVSLNGGRAGR